MIKHLKKSLTRAYEEMDNPHYLKKDKTNFEIENLKKQIFELGGSQKDIDDCRVQASKNGFFKEYKILKIFKFLFKV